MDPRLLQMILAQLFASQGQPPAQGAAPGGLAALGAAPGMLGAPLGAAFGQGPAPQNNRTPAEQMETGASTSPDSALPGVTTPEQAAAERYEAMQRAGQMPGQHGMFDGILPSGPGRTANLFAHDPAWYSGVFDTTKRMTPFDSFYVPLRNARTWL